MTTDIPKVEQCDHDESNCTCDWSDREDRGA
jgi:hypothetical protein